MALTGATVRTALAAVGAVGKQIRSFDELAAGANDALRQAPPGLTAAGAAAFLATMTQESAYLRTCEEYGRSLRYDPYRGRTFEMLTWSSNYAAFGRWCKAHGLLTDANQFVNNPKSLADYRWAWAGGVFFFEVNGLWRHANAGRFLEVSQGVNGGNGRIGTKFIPNGWVERQKTYRAYLALGNALLPTSISTAASAVQVAPPTLEPTRRSRMEDAEMYWETPEPADGQAKIDWPRKRRVYLFDPIGGWGGKCILRVNFGPRGGWLHLARWWIRLPDWTPNNRHRMKYWDHPIGSKGTDFAIAADWQTAPPVAASSIELDFSAPDGVHVQMIYEK